MVLSVFALSMGITAAVMPARYRKARLRLLSTALGIALGFIGLIITMPLVGHATWHAYRALIEPLPA